MKILSNAFSVNMVDESVRSDKFWLSYTPITEQEFNKIKGQYKSYVGHYDIAGLLGVECNRRTISISLGDEALLAQYIGKRLEEGATTLPEGAIIRYYKITIEVV